VNPEEVHTGESVGTTVWRYRGFYPTPDWILQLWLETVPRTKGMPMFSRSTVRDIELASALRHAHALTARGAAQLAVESAMVDAFTRLLVRHADVRQPHALTGRDSIGVRRMREFIHANHDKPVSLASIAGVVGLGRFSALRAFRQETGITPYQYLTSLRVEHARQLILRGNSLSFTAMHSGFADQSHLTRRFKRHFGVTPGAFARSTRPYGNSASITF
jgi:AraC-like DNA-binding protein